MCGHGRRRRVLRHRAGPARRQPAQGLRRRRRVRRSSQAGFWLSQSAEGGGFRQSHIAFGAPDRAAVRAFFEAAVGAGAEVLHQPQVWPEYHEHYYGSFDGPEPACYASDAEPLRHQCEALHGLDQRHPDVAGAGGAVQVAG